MEEKLTTLSTSSDSILSGFLSDELNDQSGINPSSFYISVPPSLRSSFTLANMSNITDESFFSDDYSSERSSTMSRWTNRNIASSSITDVLISPMSHLSKSSSTMSFINVGNYKTPGQPLASQSRSAMTNSTDQLSISNENFPSASSFLPLPTASSNRKTLSSVENIPAAMIDNDLQRVPHSWMLMSSSTSPTYSTGPIVQSSPAPQIVHNPGRPNSMPSWRGYLPMQFELTSTDLHQMISHFSQKVFLGGIPTELIEAELLLVLRKFGECNIKWPKNDGVNQNMPGFCHVVFRESRSVCELLKHCTRQQRSTIDYFLHIHMTTPSPSTGSALRTNRLKPIQVVPWSVRDNVYIMQQLDLSNGEIIFQDWSRTIFVSPLHGKMTAFSLASIMSNVFGPVSMAQINTDKYGYPTGTGTVLFSDSHSYMRAVAAGAIDIKCDCFHKLLDIDPFLRENEPCAFCPALADLFCRNFHCLRSYCKQCWVNKHGRKPLADHQPATRRQQQQQPLSHI